MKNFEFHSELWVPRPPDQVFPFFSEPRNLETLTPSWLHFTILKPETLHVQAGTVIDYRLQVHGIPIRWRSKITEWDPPHGFVDVQLRGPYALWHHRHTFVEQDGGTLCGDDVTYRPRGGALMNWLFVHRDLERIFNYRRQKLAQILGEQSPPHPEKS